MSGPEQSRELPMWQLVQHTADAVVADVTRSYLERQGIDPEQVPYEEFQEWSVKATGGKCAFMCALVGMRLAACFPERIREMVLVQSHSNDGHLRPDEAQWGYDTWLVIVGTDGDVYTSSPTLHSVPPERQGSLTEVIWRASYEDAIESIKRRRPHWQWPTAQEVRALPLGVPKAPANFYRYMPGEEFPHGFLTVDLYNEQDATGLHLLIDERRTTFKTLDPFDEDDQPA